MHRARYSAGMTTGDSFLREDELEALGLGSLGAHPRISRFARLYGTASIHLGDDVRVDDFAIPSPGTGTIRLEGFNHVAAGAMLFGDVTLRPWCTISSRAAVYATSDDFTLDATTYPHAGDRVLVQNSVTLGSRVVIGTGSTV